MSIDLAAGLKTGDELSDTQIEEIKTADRKSEAYERALHYLGYRPRSRSEILVFLKKKGFSDQAVEWAVTRLESFRYIDDESFARFWIENRERHRPRGRFALRYELRSKGISDSVIENLLSDHDENEAAWRALCRKLQTWKTDDEFKLKKQIHAFLRSRGFSHETIEDAVRRALIRE